MMLYLLEYVVFGYDIAVLQDTKLIQHISLPSTSPQAYVGCLLLLIPINSPNYNYDL